MVLPFEIEQDELSKIFSSDAEELIARLCEAELGAKSSSSRYFHRSSNSNTPDGGIDVMVKIEGNVFKREFVPKSTTVFQIKTSLVTVDVEFYYQTKLHQWLIKYTSISDALPKVRELVRK